MRLVRHVRPWVACVLPFLLACGETTASAPIAAGRISALSSGALTAAAGAALAERVEFRVLGTDNQPLEGVSVAFSASGTGAVDPATATSDASGIVTTRWSLSRTAGTNTLTASAGAGISTTVTATGSAGRAANVAAVSNAALTGAINTALTTAPSVRVTDAFSNVVEGVTVTWSILSGGGAITGAVSRTNAQGVAAVGSWVLGPQVGTQTLVGRVEESGVASNPMVFTAIATPGPAAQLVAVSPVAQAAPAGTAVAAPPSVRVVDAGGNAVPNASVTFAVTAGGGSVAPQGVAANAQGIATASSWTLGTVAGSNQVTATSGTLLPLVFQATGTAGAAASLTAVTGDNQTAQAGRAVAVAPSVVVRDVHGNPIAGVIVTFTVTAGGGTAVSGRQTTDAAGIAEVGSWFLGSTPGVNTLTASATGLTAVSFTATAIAGAAVSMVANSPLVQSATVGTVVSAAPSVIVRDLAGNPVPGIVVTFGVTAGGGSAAGSPATTNANGVATVTSWTLGTAVGQNVLVASASGLPSVTFTASATAGAPAALAIVSGNNEVAVTGTAVTNRPTVRVTDAQGNVIAGTTVTFAVTGGSGTITGATQATDAAGIATVGSWTLGAGAPNTLTATVAGTGITGNPATFTATSATEVVVTTAPTTPQTLGVDFAVIVQLKDSAGADVNLAGVSLTIAIASGGGTLNGTATVTTNASGAATFTINVTGAAGARTFTISGSGLTAATTTSITIN